MKQENNQDGRKGINSAALSISRNLKMQLSGFTGTSHYHKLHEKSPFIYTDGVLFMISKANAFWLLNLINSLYAHKDQFIQQQKFISIKLIVLIQEPCPSATLTVDDGNDHILFMQAITYTDFPIDCVRLFLVNNVLMLSSEY